MSSQSEEKRLKFLALDAEVQGHIHAGLRSVPLHNKRYVRWYWTRLEELQDARDAARADWREVAPPELGRIEKLIQKANGHDDLASVQAARRILDRIGIDWKRSTETET